MSRKQNDLKDIMNELVEKIIDLRHEAAKKLKAEINRESEIYSELEQLTNEIAPGASVSRMEGEDYDILSEDSEWLDLYETWSYYNDMYQAVKEVDQILTHAVGKLESMN